MKLTYDKEYKVYKYQNWEIEKIGGYITIRHWWVHNKPLDIHFWQSTKREAIDLIERIIIDKNEYQNLNKLYKNALY